MLFRRFLVVDAKHSMDAMHRLSERGSQVHSFAASAPGFHLSPTLCGVADELLVLISALSWIVHEVYGWISKGVKEAVREVSQPPVFLPRTNR